MLSYCLSSFKHKTNVLNFIMFYSIKQIRKTRLVSGVSSPIVGCQSTLKRNIKLFFTNFDESIN